MIAVPVLLLLTVIAVVSVILIGRAQTRARYAVERWDAAETLIDTLQTDAAEHIALGDSFASIVADEIRTYRTTNRTNRKEIR